MSVAVQFRVEAWSDARTLGTGSENVDTGILGAWQMQHSTTLRILPILSLRDCSRETGVARSLAVGAAVDSACLPCGPGTYSNSRGACSYACLHYSTS